MSALASHAKDTQVKICIQRKLGGIGDILMTTPLAKAFKSQYPKCEFTYATKPGVLASVLENNPFIDKVIDFQSVNPAEYHLFADVTTTGLSYEKSTNPPKNRIDLFAEYVGVRLTDHKPTYCTAPKEQTWAETVLKKWFGERRNYKLIYLDIASVDQRRTWPIRHSIRLLSEITALRKDVRFVVNDFNRLLGRKWDYEFCEDVSAYGIRQSAALIEQCDLFIGPDSGMLHIAGALERDIVAVFGSTPAAARINHYQNAIAVETDLSCQPCWYRACHIKYKCLAGLEPFRVRDMALARLDDTTSVMQFRSPVHIFTLTPSDHESEMLAGYLKAGFGSLDITSQLNPSIVKPDAVIIEVIKTSLLERTDYPLLPTSKLKVAYLLVEESELSREAVNRITRGYDLLLTNSKEAMSVIARSGVAQPVYCVGQPICGAPRLSEPSKKHINVGAIILDRQRGNYDVLMTAAEQLNSSAQLRVLLPNEEHVSAKQYDLFWKDLNLFVDTSVNSSGLYAKEAMFRGVPAIAPYNQSTQDIPSGLFYGMITQKEEYVNYNEIGRRLGQGYVLGEQDIIQALTDVISSYEQQVQLAPEARDWVQKNSAQPQLKAIVNFLHQKLVNR
jgi:ADP-heptose:LPS heptosyltransferase